MTRQKKLSGIISSPKQSLSMTSNQPVDLAMHGYQIVRELGRNWEGGRITYLAHTLDHRQVVIKEFRFAAMQSEWSGYKAHEREIEVLQQLEHPRIPRYLDSFEVPSGFCLVQQYQDAPSLADRSSFTPEAIKQIALSVLEILVYLQARVPPIIHRDIKPENILVDKQMNAFLIDFGFARIRGGELALSSVAAGTPGFIPPEEQFG
jgi:serine/threonine protein kinase